MKAFILYHPESEHAREVTEFVRDFTHTTQNRIEAVSLETAEGADKAKLYDITQYPAVIAIDESGSMIRMWQGKLPLINELSYFTHD